MPSAKPGYQKNFLTPAESFYEITRSKPYLLSEEQRRQAGLAAETWRLEVVPDEPPWQPPLAKTFRKDDGTALALADLEGLFRNRAVRCIKTMQCLLDSPRSGFCSNGLWEGVALRDVLGGLGRLRKVRRLFYWGYHDPTKPKEKFISSLSLSEVLETPPGHLPVFLAFRLNGLPLPIERGGPVRMLVPESYGFKSIKWLNRIVLTNDYRANDSYASEKGDVDYAPDPFAPMKTLARLDVHAPQSYRKGEPVTMRGVAVVGASGLTKVEYWLREDRGTHGVLDMDDPAWANADWKDATLPGAPPLNWAAGLPGGQFPEGVTHLDPVTGAPRVWPLPFSWTAWQVRLEGLKPGAYEFRVRSVDLNGYAQPEPRPNPQSGIAEVPCLTFVVE
jgi:DMSO/TMAO reductase YedYZ molybdopterin-dependent catalytic subunit